MLEIESGNTTSHSVENSLRRSLWTSRMTDYRINETTTPLNKDRKPVASPTFYLISYENSGQEVSAYSIRTAIV
jgi:hypothetical protein